MQARDLLGHSGDVALGLDLEAVNPETELSLLGAPLCPT